jgi:glycogen debranching enzyme
MFGGLARRDQARSMVRFLTSPRHLWTRYPVPTLPISDPAFTCEDVYASYWNGRVWPNLNWCIIEGLYRCGKARVGEALVERTLEMLTCMGEPNCSENFHPLEAVRYSPPHCAINQGWATIAVDLILRRGMGLQPHAAAKQLHIREFSLPGSCEAQVSGLPLGRSTVRVRRCVGRRKSTDVKGPRNVAIATSHRHWLDL